MVERGRPCVAAIGAGDRAAAVGAVESKGGRRVALSHRGGTTDGAILKLRAECGPSIAPPGQP